MGVVIWLHSKIIKMFGYIITLFQIAFSFLENYVNADKTVLKKTLFYCFVTFFILLILSLRFDSIKQFQYPIQILILILVFAYCVPEIIYSACTSVLACVCILLVVNILTATIISLGLYKSISTESHIYPLYWLSIYSIIWIGLSLLANSRVAKLSNEIISGIFVMIFTLFTYFISLLSDKMIINHLSRLNSDFTSDFWIVLQQMANEGYGPTRILLIIVSICLPFIGLSSISIVLISIKEYWINKYGENSIIN